MFAEIRRDRVAVVLFKMPGYLFFFFFLFLRNIHMLSEILSFPALIHIL